MRPRQLAWWCGLAWALLAALEVPLAAAEGVQRPGAVWVARDGTFAEHLAAKEVRRYVYVRTGTLLDIVHDMPAAGPVIIVAGADRAAEVCPEVGGLLRDQQSEDYYVVKTTAVAGRPALVVAGRGTSGLLYAAYRFAEHLGVRFYMHGDVVPDSPVAWTMPQIDEHAAPLFDRRGIQPFHDFPEGPDWWSTDDYKAILAQLPKMGMNFFGLHTYPEGGVGPEPLTWIGLPEDVADDGTVRFAYPARHFVTSNITGAWGYRPMKTSDYVLGAAALFETDDFGADYMRDTYPWNRMSPEASCALFNRMGQTLRESFTFARRLGIKTCLGTETPLTIPTPVKARLKERGLPESGPESVKLLYQGIFRRIMKTHPLDYYWLWTPEGWTWSEVSQEQIDATVADLRLAIAAAAEVKAPFELATCGWVLGPPQDRALFDKVLPKNMPVSCINRQVGHDPVEPGFAKVEGRPKWAIPWLEDDPALNSAQLWVGRMRKDAADALAYGCTGLMGIHWRTRVLGPNVSALAKAAWDQTSFNPAFGKVQPLQAKLAEGPVGGQYAHFPNSPIAETEDDPLYQHVRYDVDAYLLDVPNGTYAVTLRFCEPHYTAAGRRVFGVKIQGQTVIESIDIFQKVGKDRALDYTFKDIAVTDGRLAIEFVRQV